MLKNKLFNIGRLPEKESDLQGYSTVINVSENPNFNLMDKNKSLRYFWIPCGECDVFPLEVFFAVLRIVEKYRFEEKPIYLHCQAGVNRSQTIGYVIYRALGYFHNEIKNVCDCREFDNMFCAYDFNNRKGFIDSALIDLIQIAAEDPKIGISKLQLIRSGKITV